VDSDRRRTADAAAAQLGFTPFDPLAVWQHRFKVGHHFVLRDGDKILAYGAIHPSKRPRTAHSAAIQLAVQSDRGRLSVDASPLLAILLDLADNWLGTWRASLDILPDDPRWPLLQQHGFEREAIRKDRVFVQGRLQDAWHVTRLRPGFTPHVVARTPPQWPPVNPLGPDEILTIRTADPSDAPGYAEGFQDPALAWGVLQVPHVATVESWRLRLASNDRMGRHPLVAEIGGEQAGHGGIFGLDPPSAHVGGIGMGVHPRFQGRGVGRAIMSTLLEIGEEHLGFTRIELEVYVDNERAVRLYRSFGFEMEGTLRFHAMRDGTFVDTLMMARVSAG
jgi:putative acetyltransferase